MEVVRHLKRTKVPRARWKKNNLLNVITVSLLGEVNFPALVTYCMVTSCADSSHEQPVFIQCMSASGFYAIPCELIPCTTLHQYMFSASFKPVLCGILFLKIIV